MHANTAEWVAIDQALHKAIQGREFELHYQPIMDVRTQLIVSAEALIRWNDGERGLVGPDSFVPLAERAGLIGPISDWVVESACAMAAPAPKVRAKAHASRKRYAVGSHRLGEAHITLLSLKEKWTVRARRGGRAALAAAPRVRIFKVAREPKTGARRESLSSVTRFKGGLWLSGFRFERREQPVSTCVRLCTLKPALWQETCCRPRAVHP